MIDPTHRTASHLLLGAAALLAVLAIVAFFVISRGTSPQLLPEGAPQTRTAATDPAAKPATSEAPAKGAATHSASPTVPTAIATTPASSFTLARTAGGRIAPESLPEFTPQPYPGGPPAYDGEPVIAYIAVPSTGRKVALTVNQLGEFPRQDTAPSETVEVRLAFARTAPGAQVAIVAQDGGRMHTGKLSTALAVDAARQVAFAFKVSPNVGLHRIAVTTPTGEITTLEFWAGPPPILMQAASR